VFRAQRLSEGRMASHAQKSALFADWSEHCWLHPVHGTPAQYPLQVAKKEGHEGLQHVLEEAASGIGQLPHSKPIPLLLTEQGIQCQDQADHAASQISMWKSTGLLIRLEFSDVICTGTRMQPDDGPTHVLLIALEAPESDLYRPVWLICGRFRPDGLQDCLEHMGERGAVRWNLSESYNALKPCGRGLHGSVFVGVSKVPVPKRKLDQVRSRKVAIKVMHSDEACARREVRLMSQFHEHPNIVSLLGAFHFSEQACDDSKLALVMELGVRGDVADLIGDGAVSWCRGIQIMVGVTSALAFLHDRRVVHRDVKPENVVLQADMRAVLIDFSIAASLDDAAALRACAGTPGYVAPEIIEGRPYDEGVDVFSAGVLWFVLLSRRLPFSGQGAKEILASSLRCDIQLAFTFLPNRAEPGVRPLLQGMLSKESSRRFSAREAFVSFWSLSADVRQTPVCIESERVLAAAGLVPLMPGQEVSVIPQETTTGRCGSHAEPKEVESSFFAAHVLEYVFQTFCFQRLHVFGTHQLLTVNAH